MSQPETQVQSPGPGHVPVLLNEIVAVLRPQPGETYADATAGRGGHAAAMATQVGASGAIVLNDADAENLAFATTRVQQAAAVGESKPLSVTAIQGNFAMLPRRMEGAGLAAHAFLADLGFASNQIDRAERGFSFARSGPLDMRFDASRGLSAFDLVNQAPERELSRIFREYGEEPGAGRVARAIIAARAAAPITTTDALADVIRSVVSKPPDSGIDPATRSFQGLRIAVNDELGSLDALLALIRLAAEKHKVSPVPKTLSGSGPWLAPGARVAILTFHSLEDRPVKAQFADMCKHGLATDLAPGGITATEDEKRTNPRARSARLRAIRLIGA
ncbi:MAG: 16S rRNA (cytosine(1402)-N(4))-methyltransferase RsmH [Phycisphaerales bacterium]|nr:16S rRNA (cytosine(1402)-N(4))-methyltransferase RsmH [Phycisphaerales bacterium]